MVLNVSCQGKMKSQLWAMKKKLKEQNQRECLRDCPRPVRASNWTTNGRWEASRTWRRKHTQTNIRVKPLNAQGRQKVAELPNYKTKQGNAEVSAVNFTPRGNWKTPKKKKKAEGENSLSICDGLTPPLLNTKPNSSNERDREKKRKTKKRMSTSLPRKVIVSSNRDKLLMQR
jgi:hypothetical protein